MHVVHQVVGGHDRPGLGFFDRNFKRGQIELMQRALIQVRAGLHALELLVVGRVVLQRGANALTLYPQDVGSGHFPCQ